MQNYARECNMKKFIAVFAIISIAFFACTPKKADKDNQTSKNVSSIDPEEIKDITTWKAAYDDLIGAYSSAVTQLNGGNLGAGAKIEELGKRAEALNSVAETIKYGLSVQGQADFAAVIEEYKEKFNQAVNSN